MIERKLLKVNEPNVVHETIDGEAILLDLKTGNYFSLEGAGAVIWEYVTQTGDWENAIALITKKNIEQKEVINTSIEKFILELIEENLLVPVSNGIGFSSENTAKLEENLLSATMDFKVPIINKYSDMQDLLLLDPIHDVDEKGWPEAQLPEGQDTSNTNPNK